MSYGQNRNMTNVSAGFQGPVSVAQTVPVPDSMSHIVALISQQTAELYQRTAQVASAIAGSMPEPTNSKDKPQDCLLSQLRLISEGLQRSLSEIERTQQFL